MIKFNSDKIQETIFYSRKPVIRLLKINFLTSDKNWINRLVSANLSVKISALDNKDQEISSTQEPLSFGAFVTPDHKQPVLDIHRYFRFSSDIIFQDHSNCNKWKIDIVLNNIIIKKSESFTIEYMDSKYIESRVDDWEKRVHDLIEMVNDWSGENDDIEVKASRKQIMHEGLMEDFGIPMREIESADVLKNGKIIITIKPFGLWIMGANGRLDLLMATGNFVLVDQAKRFQIPEWKLFLKHDKNRSVDFNKEFFYQLIGA